MTMVNTSNKSKLHGDLRLYAKDILAAAGDAPSAIAAPLTGAIGAVIAILDSLTQAQAEAARILNDAKFSLAYRYDSARATVEAAVNAANDAVTALENTATKRSTPCRKTTPNTLLKVPGATPV
jgi:hypothetical protein